MYSVYVFLDPKNRPYYVGKTNNMKRRRKEHLAEINNGNKLPKYNAARKLKRQGYAFKMRAIRTTKNEAKAYRLERYFIKKFRGEGYCLFNCTYGGPDEKPMRIKKLKKTKPTGIKFPTSRKPKKKIKNKRRKRRMA